MSTRREQAAKRRAERTAAGQGLKNMRRRAETIDGGFSLRSLPGRGTAVEVTLRA